MIITSVQIQIIDAAVDYLDRYAVDKLVESKNLIKNKIVLVLDEPHFGSADGSVSFKDLKQHVK